MDKYNPFKVVAILFGGLFPLLVLAAFLAAPGFWLAAMSTAG
jgi:hypothetical protein